MRPHPIATLIASPLAKLPGVDGVSSGSGETPSFLLDTFTGAAGAYSLRKIATGITNVARVRRSSDSSELDVSETDITDGTLTAFCGAGDGFVTKLYAQNSGGVDLVQATAIQQPKIVASGVLCQVNSKPAMLFSGSQKMRALFTLGNPVSGVLVAQSSNTSGIMFDGGTTSNRNSLFYSASTLRLYNTSAGFTAAFSHSAQHVIAFLSNAASSILRVDASETTGAVGSTNAMDGITIGSGGGDIVFWTGYMQEVIVWDSDYSANFAALETVVNAHYGVY